MGEKTNDSGGVGVDVDVCGNSRLANTGGEGGIIGVLGVSGPVVGEEV